MRSQVRHWQRWGVKEGLAGWWNKAKANRLLLVSSGKVDSDADAQYPKELTSCNGWIRQQDCCLNEGSL